MAKRLIIVSPPGERLKVSLADGAVRSDPSDGDDYTHLIVDSGAAEHTRGARDAAQPEPKGDEPPPPPDITMSLVGGLPPGFAPWRLDAAMKVTGPLTVADLAGYLAAAPEGGEDVLLLGLGHGG